MMEDAELLLHVPRRPRNARAEEVNHHRLGRSILFRIHLDE
jgi:hypothetical protein